TALLLRADVLREVGGFDPRFFAYREEDDLCARILRRGRWNLAAVADAECVHLMGGTTGEQSPFALCLLTRNGWLFVRKHTPVWRWPRVFLRMAAVAVLRAAALHRSGRGPQARAVLAGLVGMATNRFHK